MSSTTQTYPLDVPQEVLAFASSQGLDAYLPPVLEITGQLFPEAKRTVVQVQDDPEIAGERTIVIEIDVTMDIPNALAAQRRWNDRLFACCPAPLVCFFALSLELVDR